jgi:predicted CopG family antitoxin
VTTKLTLTVEEDVIKKAKSYAKQTGRSLSELIENYLETLTDEHSAETLEISPKLRKLAGSVKLPADFDEKKELTAYFEQKHL